jgi:hypothetical protein
VAAEADALVELPRRRIAISDARVHDCQAQVGGCLGRSGDYSHRTPLLTMAAPHSPILRAGTGPLIYGGTRPYAITGERSRRPSWTSPATRYIDLELEALAMMKRE